MRKIALSVQLLQESTFLKLETRQVSEFHRCLILDIWIFDFFTLARR